VHEQPMARWSAGPIERPGSLSGRARPAFARARAPSCTTASGTSPWWRTEPSSGSWRSACSPGSARTPATVRPGG